MDSAGGTVIGVTIIAGGINAYHTYTQSGALDVPKTALSNAALLLTFAGIGQFLDWKLANVLAILYFIGTIFSNGLPFLEWTTKLVGGK